MNDNMDVIIQDEGIQTIIVRYPEIKTVTINTPGPKGGNGIDGVLTGVYTSSLYITGSISSLYGFTGSLYGTSAYSLYTNTASYSDYAVTSSLPLRGVVSATAQNSSIIFKRGDNTTFQITLVQSGAIAESASYSLTAEQATTASYVLHSTISDTASRVSNISGTEFYIPRFTTASGIISSTIYQSGSYTSIRNSTGPDDVLNPDILYVNGDGVDTRNLISAHGNRNDFVQINIQNYSNLNNASSDIVATADNGTDTTYYIDMGINSDGYTNNTVVGYANDAYMYSTGNDLYIGNASFGRKVVLFNGGLDANANARVYIHPSGTVGINTVAYNTINPPSLQVKATNGTTYNVIQAYGDTDNYSQVANTNINAGVSASADIVAYNNIDPDNQLAGYIDLGINSTNYISNSLYPGERGDAYVFTDSHHLLLGTISSSADARVTLFAGGVNELANSKLILFGSGYHQLTGSLDVKGSITSSLLGTASWALNVVTSSYSLTSSYTQIFPYTGSAIVSGSLIVTGSIRGGITGSLQGTSSYSISSSYTLTASYALNATAASSFPYTGSAVISGSLLITGSLNSTSITGSHFGTSSYAITASSAIQSLTSSFSTTAATASYFITSSVTSASFSTTSITSSYAATASIVNSIFEYRVSTTITGSTSVIQSNTSSFTTTFVKYTISSASNARSGDIRCVWIPTTANIVFDETTTADIGTTTPVTASFIISQSQTQLVMGVSSPGVWTFKAYVINI